MRKFKGLKFGKGKRDMRRIGAAIVAAMMVVALVIGLIPNETAKVLAATSDYGTETKYSESLGDNASTEYTGRIWTDKSVYSEASKTFDLYGGGKATITNDSDFLIAYSALATSQEVKSDSVVPLDVVFVLDMSGSMSTTMDNRQNRLYNAVTALNDSMKKLLALNDYVRVGVVSFNSTAYEILPLEHYEQVSGREFITCSGTTITVNADGTSTDRRNYTVRSSSGTNIQKGIFDGMNMLASEQSIKAVINGKEVDRVPSLIILSDGQPSNASNYTSWWNIANDTASMSPVGSRSIYGMKALMTATYMKAAIDRNYGTPNVKVYSIGVGIDDLSTNDEALAYVTINPSAHLATSNNTLVTPIRTAWDNYANNRTATLNGYTFTHPSQYDIVNTKNYSDLYYVDSYYDVTNKNTMDQAFQSIVESIMVDEAEAPTEITTNDPLTDGYITYTDPIGEYMEVKEIKSILYAGQEFTLAGNYTPTTVGQEEFQGDYAGYSKYTFTGEVHSAVYGEQDLSKVIIMVSPEKEELVIMIPAGLIPIRVNFVEIDENGNVISHTNNGTYPIRVLYTVGMKDGVVDENGMVTSQVAKDYINANINEDGTVNFYSNLFTGKTHTFADGTTGTIGNATVEFSPSPTNPFYYVQEKMYVYTDESCQTYATEIKNDGTIYYYKDEFYHELHVDHVAVARTGQELNIVALQQDQLGWCRTIGTPRLNRMMEFEGKKVENGTNTASEFYVPTFYTEHNDIIVYLGNNGVRTAKAGGTLQISKEVKAEDGFTAPDSEFAFRVDLTAAGTYNLLVRDAEGNLVGDTDNDGITGTVTSGQNVTLKAGYTATIINLPIDTEYTVTETLKDGFTTTVKTDAGTQTTNVASGEIVAGEISHADFVNTYSPDPVIVDTAVEFPGTKRVNDDWPWADDKEFVFLIKPYTTEPLPKDDAGNDVESASVLVNKNDKEKRFDFGTFTFEEEGIYRYTIVEKEPENHAYLPGVSYSRAMYEVTITVEDNGTGKLVADVDVQKIYDDNAVPQFSYVNGQPQLNDTAKDSVNFTNVYDHERIVRVPTALKSYTDNSGGNSLVDGMFEFRLTPLGVVENNNVVANTASQVPMPEGTNGFVTTENEGTTVTFPAVVFTPQNIPQGQSEITFRYQMEEVIPSGAVNNVLNGMSYDAQKYEIDVTVSYDDVNDELNVDAVYPDGQRIVTFNNSYTPEAAAVSLQGTKAIDGRDWTNADSFEFQLEAVTAGAPMPGTTTAKVDHTVNADANGFKAFAFDEIQYTKAGTYQYKITELGSDANGVVIDKHECDVTVTVELDKASGKLEAKAVYYGDTAKSGAEFVNVYTAVFDNTTAVNLTGRKYLTGRDVIPGEFYFHVTPLNNAPMGDSFAANAVVVDDTTDEATFQILKNVTYTAVGEYRYEVTEIIPTGAVNHVYAGVTYDTSKYTVVVKVTDDGLGKLKAEAPVIIKEDGTQNGTQAGEVVFNNSYEANSTTLTLPVFRKGVTGRDFDPAAEKYDFSLSVTSAEPQDGIQLPANVQVQNDDNGEIHFENITLTKAGTYTVTVGEVIPANALNRRVNGISYDQHVVTMTIEVTDNGRGQLAARYVNATGSTTFENKYEAAATSVTLEGEKVLNGRSITADDKFDFVIRAVDYMEGQTVVTEAGKTPVPASREVFNNGSKITFGPIVYYETGIYAYEIVELDEDADGIIYDKGKVNVIVTVTDTGHDGQLDASYAYTKEGQGEGFQFINEYYAEHVEVEFAGNKIINNFTMQGGEFVFRLHPAESNPDGDPISETSIANGADGAFNFGKFTYTQPGTYIYGIGEATGNIHGVDYDETLYTVTVTITDNGMGELEAATEVLRTNPDESKDAVTMNDIVFRNAYNPDDATAIIHGHKHLDGALMTDGQFHFKLTAITAGAPMPQLDVVSNTAAGMFHFPSIVYDETHIGNTYEYKITEEEGNAAGYHYDDASHVVKVTVKQDEQKQLYVETEYPEDDHGVNFYNSYTPNEVTLTGDLAVKAIKKLAGRQLKAEEFLFEIFGEEGAPMPQKATATNDAEGNIVFGDITFTETGVYSYTIAEKNNGLEGVSYDETVYGVIVTVTDEGYDGQLDAEATYVKDNKVVEYAEDVVFNNTYTEKPQEEPDIPEEPKKPEESKEETSHTSPKTSDDANVVLSGFVVIAALIMLGILTIQRKKSYDIK